MDIEIQKKIKEIELNILLAFVDACAKLKLSYYLIGGTLLGAIRHQGFIPWDDDIDVGMPRADYEIFLEKAQALLPEYYFVQCRKTDPELPNNFAKIRDSRTTFIEKSVKDKKINHGIYIDIFPLDYYPESLEEQKKVDMMNKLLSLRIRSTFTLPIENRHSKLAEFGASMTAKILSLKWPTVEDALEARESLYKSTPESELVINFSGTYGKREVVQKEWFGPGAEALFEGTIFKVPLMYDAYLTNIYGDYMKLPPIEKRVSHHYSEIIDTEKPYTEYI